VRAGLRGLATLGVFVGTVACDPVTGPGDVSRVEGAFCEQGKPDEAVLETDSWRVTIFYNESLVRDVVEDEVHRNVEFRSCASMTCRVDPGFAATAEDAITACRKATNIPSPLIRWARPSSTRR
jgi:SH3-like domain-containing protein